ncbi:Nramp family divalent metal transporter [Verrucomicrobia bacterium]|jgi:manganese transport protein|nr:Nramp family divalent metal transporter [Verrucomicrobiota bacterium]MDA7867049.1 Nramp family divalent metal transporter [Verrucomicrobiota bacterium]
MAPPSDLKGILKQLGPGLIISANIVGSGELIVTTKVGADAGFALLWFIILGCMIKVFLQVELGRYTLGKGKSTLEALNSVPGPRLKFSWLVWCWIVMFVATFFQLSGMVGGIAGVFRMGGSSFSDTTWALLITGSCAVFLFIGRYRFIERFSTTMVAVFTIFTIFAVFSLYWTDYGITFANLAEGLKFKFPDNFTTAFAAFGVIGVGAAELIYYPYWCLEKGYASHVGPNDGTAEWGERAQGWMKVLRWDAWLSMVIYTGATVAFYLLGAAVLHGKGLSVTNDDLIPTLSNLYRTSFGNIGLGIFLVGATVVLYSTIFISTASNARLAADLLKIGKLVKSETEQQRQNLIKISCVALPTLYFIFYVAVGKPLTLVFIGAIAQALMLPLLCFAALYFHFNATDKAIKPGSLWMTFLWIAAILMTSVGIYQLVQQVMKLF